MTHPGVEVLGETLMRYEAGSHRVLFPTRIALLSEHLCKLLRARPAVRVVSQAAASCCRRDLFGAVVSEKS